MTAKHGVSQEDVFRRGGHADGIDDAVYEFASMANQHVRTARDMFEGKVPDEAVPVFLSAVECLYTTCGCIHADSFFVRFLRYPILND